MKHHIFILAAIFLLISACATHKYTVRNYSTIEEIEKSIHSQFYTALQELNLESGIDIVPQTLNVKFDHTLTNTTTGGITAFSIVTANYQNQTVSDNSVTDILVPTKVASAGADHEIINIGYNIIDPCPFDTLALSKNDTVLRSIKNLKDLIKGAAKSFSDVPNLGLLNDHQVTLDIKFTYSNQGDISVNPVITYLMLSKVNAKYQVNKASTDDITFTFDVVTNDVDLISNARYNFIRDSTIKANNGICEYFKKDRYYVNDTISRFLKTPPVQDQHSFNACVAYAVGFTALSTHLNSEGLPFTNTNEYSPDFLYARLTDAKCGGLELTNVLNEVVKHGDVSVADFPIVRKMQCDTYRNVAYVKLIGKLIPKANDIHDKVKIGWLPLDPNNIDQIRLCINNGEPVIVAFYESSSFINMWRYDDTRIEKKNIWRFQSGPYTDAHCVCIIGYDNNTKLFKVQNSWGDTNSAGAEDPKEKGFFWVTFDMVQRGCFNQAFSFIPQIKPRN